MGFNNQETLDFADNLGFSAKFTLTLQTEDTMYFDLAIGIFGGLGLFLYGMQLMGNGLEKAAGKRLERIIEILTSNKIMGVFVGIFVTSVIQSSSATTVMVVGFVNAGVMKLTQAVGVIMGANIGTTVTGQIVALGLEHYAPIAIGLGVTLMMTVKKDNLRHTAQILLGLGILFLGMEILKDALKPLREIQAFNDAMINLSHNPILGVLVGFVLTFVVQSSSASIGMLIAIASQGALPLTAAIPILYGDNIGTCTTALISSIGTNKNARRAAIIHLIFNLVGTVLFLTLLTAPIKHFVELLTPGDIGKQIANTHTLFNVMNVLIQLPFSFLLVKIALLVIPDKGDEAIQKSTLYIDSRILGTPSIALNSAIREAIHMCYVVKDSFVASMNGFFNSDVNLVKKTYELEKVINTLEREITDYLVALSNKQVGDEERVIIDALFNNINDIERIGDHVENIAELTESAINNRLNFTGGANEELQELYKRTLLTFEYAIEAYETGKTEPAVKAISMEGEIDELEESCRRGHITRLNSQQCTTEAGIIYLDIVGNLERISDLAAKLARVNLEVGPVHVI
jgi:phosphate:Na+ symporter